MRRYETIVIVRPGAGETDIAAVADRVTGTIGSFAGSMVKNDRWGIRRLAYPIKKETQGCYLFFEYAGQPDAVKEMERQLRIDDRVLKFLTVKTQDVFTETAPQAAGAEQETEETAARAAE